MTRRRRLAQLRASPRSKGKGEESGWRRLSPQGLQGFVRGVGARHIQPRREARGLGLKPIWPRAHQLCAWASDSILLCVSVFQSVKLGQ